MRYIYGPVDSRRLGFSLGLSLTPQKVCTFDCIYCQLGKTTYKTTKQLEYIEIKEILDELKNFLANEPDKARQINYITLSGFGEPTLNIKIAELISQIKKMTKIPVCLITNSALLSNPIVRKSILQADLIIPTLNAVTQEDFDKISNPETGITIDKIVESLIALKREYAGQFWLEVMIIKGINDDIRKIKKLKEIVDQIHPNKIQLNSPVRLPVDSSIFGVEELKLEKIKEILGDNCEII